MSVVNTVDLAIKAFFENETVHKLGFVLIIMLFIWISPKIGIGGKKSKRK